MCCGFLSPLKPIALAGFESANFGSSGKHTNHYTTKTTNSDGTNNIIFVSRKKLLTDIMFLYGADRTVKEHAAMSSSPVYYYYFTYDGNLALTKQFAISAEKGKFERKERRGFLFNNCSLRVACTVCRK
jgi:hypothetical protein